MDPYIMPIKTAILLFPVLAFLFTLPFLVVQYRRYGNIPALRTIIIYSFIFCLISAFFLTLLPLPSRESVAAMTSSPFQLVPFQFIHDFLAQTKLVLSNPSTYLPAIKQGVFLQPTFNLLLLLPFGIYLRYYFEKSWKKTLLFCFLLSLFFELTQLSGIYGIYPRAYRLFDVDDLILNTLGGMLGYLLTPFLVFFLPKRKEIDRKAILSGQLVSPIRRGVATLIDWTFLSIFLSICDFVLPNSLAPWLRYFIVLAYFLFVSYLFHGRTLGKRLVKIKTVSNRGSPLTISELWKKYALFYAIFPLIPMLLQLTSNISHWEGHPAYIYILFANLALFSISFLFLVFLGLYFLHAMIKKKPILFHDKWSNTHLESTIPLPENADRNK